MEAKEMLERAAEAIGSLYDSELDSGGCKVEGVVDWENLDGKDGGQDLTLELRSESGKTIFIRFRGANRGRVIEVIVE